MKKKVLLLVIAGALVMCGQAFGASAGLVSATTATVSTQTQPTDPPGLVYPIVLAHGMMADDQIMDYWYGIEEILLNSGLVPDILTVNVTKMQSTAAKAAEFKKQVEAWMEAKGYTKVHVIAHSHGGLYARYAISNLGIQPSTLSASADQDKTRTPLFAALASDVVSATSTDVTVVDTSGTSGVSAEYSGSFELVDDGGTNESTTATNVVLGQPSGVFSLTTLGTPHRGSAIAEWVCLLQEHKLAWNALGNLFDFVYKDFLGDEDPYSAKNAIDVSISYCTGVFNPNTPDHPQVHYFSYASTIVDPDNHYDIPMVLAYRLYQYLEGRPKVNKTGESYDLCDGLVHVASAKWGEYIRTVDDYPGVSHMGIVNQWQGNTPNFDERAFYMEIVHRLNDLEAENGIIGGSGAENLSNDNNDDSLKVIEAATF